MIGFIICFAVLCYQSTPLPVDVEWHKKLPELRAEIVWDSVCEMGGWWGRGCPSEQEVAAILLFREGSVLQYADKVLMMRGIRYRFDRFGFEEQLSGFTSFYNPISDGVLDRDDWYRWLMPPPESYFDIADVVYKSEIKQTDGNYLYWWTESEVVGNIQKMPHTTATGEDGTKLYFSGIPNAHKCATRGICN